MLDKLTLDLELLRRGGNQLGMVAMSAGLVAYFIDSIPGYGEQVLFMFGLLMYIVSIIRLKPALIDNSGDSPSGGN